ncbi:hypothetical protein ACP4OV_018951 [Aristida adscensionis]
MEAATASLARPRPRAPARLPSRSPRPASPTAAPHRAGWCRCDPRAASTGGDTSSAPGRRRPPRLAAAPRTRSPANLGFPAPPRTSPSPSPAAAAWGRRTTGDRRQLRPRPRLVVECSGGPAREERPEHAGDC